MSRSRLFVLLCSQGARWVRCDVGLHKGASGLNKLPVSVVLGTLSTTELRCLTGTNLTTTSDGLLQAGLSPVGRGGTRSRHEAR